MNNILVTGGAGMIGSSLVKRLVKQKFKVSVIDNLWRGKLEYLFNDSGQPVIDIEKDFHDIDVSKSESFNHLMEGIDYVFHLADVVAGIDYVFKNQGDIFRQNMLINSNVINTIRKHPVQGLIYVGTACSFPAAKQYGINAPPLREEDQFPAQPESSYGWSKLMGEYEALLMEKEEGIPVSILVLHNVYGSPCDYDEKTAQVIPSLIRKAIRYPIEPFVVWGSGNQGRAFVHVDDVVHALVSTLKRGLGQGVIQIGPDVCTSIRKIAEMIVELSGKDIDIDYDMSRPEGDLGRCANYSKAKEILGWTPKIKLFDGLKRLYKWVENKLNKSIAIKT